MKTEQNSFFEGAEAAQEACVTRFSSTLNIAIIGNVSAGKSSLINALLGRDRNNMVAPVGAEAGTTKELRSFKLDDHVRIIDSPGLLDIRRENSEVTVEFLKFIDIGILVLTGAADSVQRGHLLDLRHSCDQTFVVLNKIDQWDKNKAEAIAKVEQQWKNAIDVGHIYKVCCFGYDPDTHEDTPLDIRGIQDLRKDIESYLALKGKDMLLQRHMSSKEDSAVKIISGALIAVTAGSLLPGAALIVVTAQISALYSLYYLYTGKILAKAAIGSILVAATGQAIVPQLFLALKSMLPPTGLADVAAAYVAVVFTFALLASFTKLLEKGMEDITGAELLVEFKSLKTNIQETLKASSAPSWNSEDFWRKLIRSVLL